jgi:hypothetical protein
MTVDSAALSTDDLMLRRRESSYQLRRPQSTCDMKAQQSAKIRELGDALVAVGIFALDDQAEALGLSRSTTWTILKGNHKASGLSATTINRILAAPKLPPLVRAKVLEYVEEKAAGRYGHSDALRRRFVTRLSGKLVEPISNKSFRFGRKFALRRSRGR